jgi:short-subunit dehydrogenase
MHVVITGASSGLGEALARVYAGRGARLTLMARRVSELTRLQGELGRDCSIYALDVSDAAAVQKAAGDLLSRSGCPDIVIANAGVSVGTLTECAEDSAAFARVLAINVLGAVHTFQPFVEPMRARGKGVLAGISSVAGYRGLPGAGAYSASKAALTSYLESLRVELKPSGIAVVTICPGYIETPMTQGNPYPMPFMMTADAAATAVVSLIARRKTYTVIPWQMAIVARVLRAMPNSLYDRLFVRAPRKPRRPV